jgi:hypothetical protein
MGIKDLIKNSVDMQVTKAKKNKKKKGPSNNNIGGKKAINTTQGGKNINFETTTSYNDKEHSLPMYYNGSDITYNFYTNLQLAEYSIIPKDERAYNEEYKVYFNEVRKAFLKDLNIQETDPLLDVDKFVLLVTFDNFEGRLSLSEMVLVDPLNDYKRYYVKFEQPETMREYYLFTGQIIYVNGFVKNDEIYVNKIINGMTLLSYKLDENYVKSFYKEVKNIF